ncbi:MAG TPA: tetratricopeptide repeat protein [Kofleriaceae bacterium]|nr:tetratricopeptide repeat protein [Kofleriaceae bacterium]
MWTGYSTREAAELMGMPESAIRACARAGLLSEGSAKVPARLSFRDLKVLRLVKELGIQGLSMRRIRNQLGELQRRLPQEGSLAELNVAAQDGHIVVRDSAGDQRRSWRADTGQMLLEFEAPSPTGELAAIPARREAPAPEPIAALTAEDWFDRALAIEEEDPAAAIGCYQKALKLRPDSPETWINMGRLHAEGGRPEEARECFRVAVGMDPDDATAVYNLGVVAQDLGDDREAIDHYRRSLELDPTLCEAHYNLATIYDRAGDTRSAIRHINEYRKLTRNQRS